MLFMRCANEFDARRLRCICTNFMGLKLTPCGWQCCVRGNIQCVARNACVRVPGCRSADGITGESEVCERVSELQLLYVVEMDGLMGSNCAAVRERNQQWCGKVVARPDYASGVTLLDLNIERRFFLLFVLVFVMSGDFLLFFAGDNCT